MDRENAYKKERELLLRRHNKANSVKLKSVDVIIPEEIINILCHTGKRKKEETVLIEAFRKQALLQLMEISDTIRKERQLKAKRTREANLEKDPRFVKHFGVWINQELPFSKISREHYADIESKSTVVSYERAKDMLEIERSYPVICNDETREVFYTSEYCMQHQKNALRNFDINMERFASLDKDEFEKTLQHFIKGRKFQEVFSLEDPLCTENRSTSVCGFVYIMVLDEYKQVYIGITGTTVKNRIKQHWRQKRAFDRLIFGLVDNSVISIDSFGPLDTTRLFVRQYTDQMKTPIDRYEYDCIRAFDSRFLLNRLN